MRKLLTVLGLAVCCAGMAQTRWASAIEGELILPKTYLTISYSPANKIPNYVGYFLTPDRIRGDAQRESYFYADSDVPSKYREVTANYSNTGYDRGHMSPAASWRFSQDAMHESFCMSNICPQNPSLNRHWWEQVEELERYYAHNCDTLFIVTGVICNKSNPKYIKNGVRVPDKFYKACVGVHDGEVIISIGWVFKNIGDKQTLENTARTIDQIERAAKVDLYNGFWFNEVQETKIMKP